MSARAFVAGMTCGVLSLLSQDMVTMSIFGAALLVILGLARKEG